MKNIINTHKQGKLITFDGPDGVGKSTVVKLLAEQHGGIYYKTPGEVTMEERDKYDFPEISVQDRFNFYVGLLMKDAVRIKDILNKGNNVFCDRFTISTIVHHKVLDPNIDISRIQNVIGIIKSDCSIIFYGNIETLIQRISSRDIQTRFELDKDLVVKTQIGFLEQPNIHTFDNTSNSIEKTMLNITQRLKNLNIL